MVENDDIYIKHVSELGKKEKLEAIENIQVEHNTVIYDAHTIARGDFTGVVALANYTFIRAMYEASKNVTEDDALHPYAKMIIDTYEVVYKESVVWRGADNLNHTVQAESIAETAQAAMEEYAKILGAK